MAHETLCARERSDWKSISLPSADQWKSIYIWRICTQESLVTQSQRIFACASSKSTCHLLWSCSTGTETCPPYQCATAEIDKITKRYFGANRIGNCRLLCLKRCGHMEVKGQIHFRIAVRPQVRTSTTHTNLCLQIHHTYISWWEHNGKRCRIALPFWSGTLLQLLFHPERKQKENLMEILQANKTNQQRRRYLTWERLTNSSSRVFWRERTARTGRLEPSSSWPSSPGALPAMKIYLFESNFNRLFRKMRRKANPHHVGWVWEFMTDAQPQNNWTLTNDRRCVRLFRQFSVIHPQIQFIDIIQKPMKPLMTVRELNMSHQFLLCCSVRNLRNEGQVGDGSVGKTCCLLLLVSSPTVGTSPTRVITPRNDLFHESWTQNWVKV